MNKIAFIFSFFLSSLLAADQNPPSKQLVDLELEINYLQAKKKLLIDHIRAARHEEINKELQGVEDMQSSHWKGFVTKLKNAEFDEGIAEKERQELADIEKRIAELTVEYQKH